MRIPQIPGFDQQAFEKYLKNTGWLMFGKILSMVVGFLIARYLGPRYFGELSFAIAFTGIILSIGSLGLDTFIIREVLQEPRKTNEILGTSFWLRLSISALLIPAAVLIYLFTRSFSSHPGDSLVLIIALCASAHLFKAFNVIDAYFQSQVRSKNVVQIQNVCLLLTSAVKVGFVWLNLPVIYFAIALVLDGLMLASGLVIIYHREKHSLRKWNFQADRAKSLISQSWPLIFSAIMVSMYMQIDTVMLKSVGSEAVGIYSVAARISESWYFIPVAIVTSVFPALIHARKTDLERYQKRLQNLYDLLVAISLPVALVVSFGANQIIYTIYGDQFNGAGLMLAIHIWSGVFVFLGSASSQYLLAEGYTLISLYRTIAGAVVNILLNIWLIPLYGGIGASVATLFAVFAANFFILLIPKTRGQGILMLKSLFLISLFQKIIRR
ncbi:MAG: flippase [Sphingobacteriaceae bacterium]